MPLLPLAMPPHAAQRRPASPAPAAAAKPAAPQQPAPEKSPEAFKTISEAATLLGVPQHVLRFWESQFSQISPLKLAGGRRYYRPEDISILSKIQHLLHKQGYTIKGAKKAFQEGDAAVAEAMEKPAPQACEPAALGERQLSQLSALKKELTEMRQQLGLALQASAPA